MSRIGVSGEGYKWIVVEDNRRSVLQIHVKPGFGYVIAVWISAVQFSDFFIERWLNLNLIIIFAFNVLGLIVLV